MTTTDIPDKEGYYTTNVLATKLKSLLAEMTHKTLSTKQRLEAIRWITDEYLPQTRLTPFDLCLRECLRCAHIDDNYYYLLRETMDYVNTGSRPLPLTIRTSLFTVAWNTDPLHVEMGRRMPSNYSIAEKQRLMRQLEQDMAKYSREDLIYTWFSHDTGFQDLVTFIFRLVIVSQPT